MLNFDNISIELDTWAKSGLFNEVSYYLGNYSNTRLIFTVWDLQKTAIELAFNDDHKMLGYIDKSGYTNSQFEFMPLTLPRSINDVTTKENSKIISKIINDGTELGLTDLYPVQRNNSIQLNDYITPICEQTILLLLSKNKDFEKFIEAMRKQIERHDLDDKKFDYIFNFILEYENDGEIICKYFWDFDCDEFDVNIDFITDATPELTLIDYKKLIFESELLNKKVELKTFGYDVHRTIEQLEKLFVLQGKITEDVLLDYHCAIEDIYRIVLRKVKSILYNLKNLNFKDHEQFKNFANLLKQSEKSVNIYNINQTFNFLLNNKEIKLETIIDEDRLIKYRERLEWLRSIKNYSNYRNKRAHSKIKHFGEETLSLVINAYRELIRYLIEFYTEIKNYN